MTIHEYEQDNGRVIVFLHPSAVMWDSFSYVVPLMEEDFHQVIPALPGYDEE
ncbi:hypothetical protein [Pseudoramibacter faecis]|uniref:hypothetical protein n=1 Tax=Pseudoramibacter faecis TaxID=3108534 RepID=UPI002E76663C|nr:hypothetical protein [Pseudoramibacter sp. HA2172]